MVPYCATHAPDFTVLIPDVAALRAERDRFKAALEAADQLLQEVDPHASCDVMNSGNCDCGTDDIHRILHAALAPPQKGSA